MPEPRCCALQYFEIWDALHLRTTYFNIILILHGARTRGVWSCRLPPPLLLFPFSFGKFRLVVSKSMGPTYIEIDFRKNGPSTAIAINIGNLRAL
jgi:hypothetical protein